MRINIALIWYFLLFQSGKHDGLLGKDDEALLLKVKSVADSAAASAAASAASASSSQQSSNAAKPTVSARHTNERKNATHSAAPSTHVKVEPNPPPPPATGGSQPETNIPSGAQVALETLKRVKSEATIVTMSQYKERKEKEQLIKKETETGHRKDQNKVVEHGIKIHIKTERDSSSDRKSHRKYTSDSSSSGSDTKYHIKKEPGSQHETLSPLKIKVEPGAPVSPLKMKIKSGTVEMAKEMTSPLKMKIKPYPKIADKNQNHSAHHSNTEKSEKHHTSKHPSSNERQPLKLKLPKLASQKHPGREDSHSRSGTNGKMEKNRSSHRQAPETNSHGHRPSSKDLDKHGTVSRHSSRAASGHHAASTPDSVPHAPAPTASSRKRPNSPAAGNLNDSSGPKIKVAKCDAPSRALARSSSSHSIHSMDLSDTGSVGDALAEPDQLARGFDSNGSGTNSPVVQENKIVINQQLQQLQHIINRQMSQIAQLQQQTPQQLAHQQSLFDLDFIGDITNPPLPNDSPLRPPTPPLPPSSSRSPSIQLQYPGYPPPPPPAPF